MGRIVQLDTTAQENFGWVAPTDRTTVPPEAPHVDSANPINTVGYSDPNSVDNTSLTTETHNTPDVSPNLQDSVQGNMGVEGNTPTPVDTSKNRDIPLDAQTRVSMFGSPETPVDMSKPGVQSIVDAEGNKEKKVVPPSMEGGIGKGTFSKFGSDFFDQSMIAAGTAAGYAGKGIMADAEWLFDVLAKERPVDTSSPVANGINAVDNVITSPLRAIANLGAMLVPPMNDHDVNWVAENVPTIATDNPITETAATLGSVVLDTVLGAKSFSDFNKAAKVSTGIAKAIWGMKEAVKTQKNGPKKLEIFVNALLHTVAGDIGSTVGTPDGTGSIAGGFLPEGTNEKVGQMIDNSVISGGLSVLGKFLSATGRGLGVALGVRPGNSDVKAAMDFMKQIDPNIDPNVKPEELKMYAQAMADVLQKYKSIGVGMPGAKKGAIDLGTTDAIRRGAKEYVEMTTNWKQAQMTPEQYSTFVEDAANGIVQNMQNFRHGRLNRPAIANSDALVNKQSNDMLTQSADSMASQADVNAVGTNLGNKLMSKVVSGTDDLAKVDFKKQAADSALNAAQSKNYVVDLLQKAQAAGKLGMLDLDKETLAQMTGDQLYTAWLKHKTSVDELYAAIPRGIGVDTERIVRYIQQIGKKQGNDILEALGVKTPEKVFKQIPDDTLKRTPTGQFDGVNSPAKDLAEQLKGKDFKDWYETLPHVEMLIQKAKVEGDAVGMKALMEFKKYITSIGEESTDGAVQAAVKGYQKFADTWLPTPELQQYDAIARKRVDNIGENGQYNIGKVETNTEGFKMLEESMSAPLKETAQKALGALQKGDPNASRGVLYAYLGQSLRALSNLAGPKAATGGITAEMIINATQPYIESIRKVGVQGESIAKKFNDTVMDLQTKAGLSGVAQADLDKAKVVYDDLMAQAQNDAAWAFLTKNKTGLVSGVTDNPEMAFKQIFESPNGSSLINQLMTQATQEGDTLAVNGIKSQVLRWTVNKANTTKSIAFKDAGQDVVNEISTAGINKMLKPMDSNFLPVLDAAYRDDPETGETVKGLLEIVQHSAETRATKGNAYGSHTAFELQNGSYRKQTASLVKLYFGVLSRAGAIANVLTGGFAKGADTKADQIAEMILDRQIIDPTYLSQALTAFKEGDNDTLKGLIHDLTIPMAKGADAAYHSDDIERTSGLSTDQNNDITTQTNNALTPANYNTKGTGEVVGNMNVDQQMMNSF